MMCEPGSLARVGWHWLKRQLRPAPFEPAVQKAASEAVR
jgi:hypothetical protein